MWVPTDVGSARVFQQIVGFSGEIVAYQELHALCDVALLASSVQPQRRGKRENKRKDKPLKVQRTFCKNRCRHCTANVVKLK